MSLSKQEKYERYGKPRRTTQQKLDDLVLYLGFVCAGGDPEHMVHPAFVAQVPGDEVAAEYGFYEIPKTYNEPNPVDCPLYQRGFCGTNGEFVCDPKFSTIYYGPGLKHR